MMQCRQGSGRAATLFLAAVCVVAASGCGSDVKVVSVSLLESGGWVKPSASVGVVTQVDNPGGASLEFKWNSARGSFNTTVTQSPSNVYKAPPDTGLDTITVEVRGGRRPASATIQVEVVEDSPRPVASSSPSPAPTTPLKASIESPTAGSSVESSLIARGTVSEGSAAHAWVVVNPSGEPGWWPQGGPLVPLPPNGAWNQQVFFGGDMRGQRFLVAVVIASDEANRTFVDYLEEGARTGKYPGKPLPPGTQILTSVEVTKR